MDANLDPSEIAKMAEAAVRVGKETGIVGWLRRRLTHPSEPLTDYRTEAEKVLKENALDTLASLELTFDQAIQILGPDFDLNQLHILDPTWQKHYLSGASNVAAADHERQIWWSRLVVGELKQPGSYSLRTIAIMDVLSQEEAVLFTRLTPYIWDVVNGDDVALLPTSESSLWRPTLSQMMTLQAAGLVTATSQAVGAKVRAGAKLAITQRNTSLLLTVNRAGTILETNMMLTQAGKEMLALASIEPVRGYLEAVIAHLETHCTVTPLARA